MDYWAILILIIIGLLSLKYLLELKWNYFEKNKIPYVKPLPLVGNMGPVIFRLKSIAQQVNTIYNINKDAKYVGFFNFKMPVLIIRDPELIKIITVKSFDHFTDHRGFIDSKQDEFFTSSMFVLRGEKWKTMRSAVSPAFTASKMKTLYPLLKETAERFTNHLVNLYKNKSGDIFAKDIFARCTCDTIVKCVFGIDIDSMDDPNNEFFIRGREATDFDGPITQKFFFALNFPMIFKLFNIKIIKSSTAQFFTNVIKDVYNLRMKNNIKIPDILQHFIDIMHCNNNNTIVDIEHLATQTFSFFFAGVDTLSTAISYTVFVLANNNDIQMKVRKEIDDLYQKTNGSPTFDDINSLEYLECVINETLRLYPPGPFWDRLCVKSFELPPVLPGNKPITILPGTTIWLPVYPLHHDPKYFKQPGKFDPNRFQRNTKNPINSGTYIPFGFGPRICLGHRFAMFEVKNLIYHLIIRFQFEISDKMIMPMEMSTKSFAVLPKGGFWIRTIVRDDWINKCQ